MVIEVIKANKYLPELYKKGWIVINSLPDEGNYCEWYLTKFFAIRKAKKLSKNKNPEKISYIFLNGEETIGYGIRP